jgi:hypothetical protein
MSTITALPQEIHTTIALYLPQEARWQLAITCKYFYKIHVLVQFLVKSENSDFSRYISTVINRCEYIWEALSEFMGSIPKEHKIELHLQSLQKGLPKLKTLVEKQFAITKLCIEAAPQQDQEIDEFSSLFEKLQLSQFHLLDCSGCSSGLSRLQYPKTVQEIFLKEVLCTKETLTPLKQCKELKKLFIDSAASSMVPRKELKELQSTLPSLQIVVVEDKESDRSLIFDSQLKKFSLVKLQSFLYDDTLDSKNSSFAEKCLFLHKHALLDDLNPLWSQETRVQQNPFRELQDSLKKEVHEHPEHVPSLLSLAILQIYRNSREIEEEFTIATLSEKAFTLDPTNVLAKVLSAYWFQKKDDAEEKARVISLLQELSNQLVDLSAIHIIVCWAGTTTPERGFEELRDYSMRGHLRVQLFLGAPPNIARIRTEVIQNLEDMTYNIKRLCILHQDLSNQRRKASYEEQKAAYSTQLEKCTRLYPKYIPFFNSITTNDTTWEKLFSPKELVILKDWKEGIRMPRNSKKQ